MGVGTPEGPPPLIKEQFEQKERELRNSINPSVARLFVGATSQDRTRFHPDNVAPVTTDEKNALEQNNILGAFIYDAAEKLSIESRREANTEWEEWTKGIKTYAETALAATDQFREERIATLKTIGLLDEGNDDILIDVNGFHQRYFANERSNIKQFITDIAEGCTDAQGFSRTEDLHRRINSLVLPPDEDGEAENLLIVFGEHNKVNFLVADLTDAYSICNQSSETKLNIVIPAIEEHIQKPIREDYESRPYLLALAEMPPQSSEVEEPASPPSPDIPPADPQHERPDIQQQQVSDSPPPQDMGGEALANEPHHEVRELPLNADYFLSKAEETEEKLRRREPLLWENHTTLLEYQTRAQIALAEAEAHRGKTLDANEYFANVRHTIRSDFQNVGRYTLDSFVAATVRSGQEELADTLLEEIQELARTTQDTTKRNKIYEALTQAFCTKGDIEAAQESLQQVDQTNTHGKQDATTALINALAKQGRVDEAENELSKITNNRSLASAEILKQRILHGDKEQALEALNQDTTTSNPFAIPKVIEGLAEIGQVEEAEALRDKLTTESPADRASALISLAEAYRLKPDHEKMLEVIASIGTITNHPRTLQPETAAYGELAKLYTRLGQQERAKQIIDHHFDKDWPDTVVILAEISTILWDNEREKHPESEKNPSSPLDDSEEILPHAFEQAPEHRDIPTTQTLVPTEEGLTVGNVETKTAEVFELNLSSTEQEQLMHKIEVHGSEFNISYDNYNGTPIKKDLLPTDLERAGLLPKYAVQVEGKTILFSTPYALDTGDRRIAVVGYVQEDDNYVARTFYLSNSQGVWRYLPKYWPEGTGVRWFDKGYGEESVTIPIALQLALNTIREETPQPIQLPENENPYFYFAGTARPLSAENITFRYEVEEQPVDLNFEPQQRFINRSIQKLPPREITFDDNPNAKPNFDHQILSWQQHTEQYGPITIEVYPSSDGMLNYMFCRDGKGRAWVGGIEDTTSDIKSVGVRKRWVNGGDLTTPAYEYDTQVGKAEYENNNDRNGPYVDMFTNYISRIPIIQEYLKKKRTS